MDGPSPLERDDRHALVTPRQAAEWLRVSIKTLDGLVHDGELAYVHVGRGDKRRRRMFTRQEINDFIERRGLRHVPISIRGGRRPSSPSLREREAQIAERKRRLLEGLLDT